MKMLRMATMVLFAFALVALAGQAQAQMHSPYGPHYGNRGTMGPSYGMYWPGAEDPQWQGRGMGMRPGMRSSGPMHTPYGPHYGQRGTFGPSYGMDWPGAYERGYDEQTQRKLGELWMVHYDKVSPIRQEIRKKKRAFNQELYSDNPDKKTLDSLRQDLNKLYSDLLDEETTFRQEVYEKTGVQYEEETSIWPDQGRWGMMAPDMRYVD